MAPILLTLGVIDDGLDEFGVALCRRLCGGDDQDFEEGVVPEFPDNEGRGQERFADTTEALDEPLVRAMGEE